MLSQLILGLVAAVVGAEASLARYDGGVAGCAEPPVTRVLRRYPAATLLLPCAFDACEIRFANAGGVCVWIRSKELNEEFARDQVLISVSEGQ